MKEWMPNDVVSRSVLVSFPTKIQSPGPARVVGSTRLLSVEALACTGLLRVAVCRICSCLFCDSDVMYLYTRVSLACCRTKGPLRQSAFDGDAACACLCTFFSRTVCIRWRYCVYISALPPRSVYMSW